LVYQTPASVPPIAVITYLDIYDQLLRSALFEDRNRQPGRTVLCLYPVPVLKVILGKLGGIEQHKHVSLPHLIEKA
jgi:hypothetical protein